MKRILLLTVLISLILPCFAQSNVGIGTTMPHASSLLELNSTSKGMLSPRMSTLERNAIAGPATGLLVFDTNFHSFWYYNGAAWKEVAGNAYDASYTLQFGQQSGTVPSANLNTTFILSGNSGFLYDSGGPLGNYGNNENNMASLLPLINQLAVEITVLSNSLENNFDTLILSDAFNNRYVLQGTATGKFRLYGTARIIFKSNGSNTQAGFSLRWDRVLTSNDHSYNSSQLAGWYFNPSKLYMRGGVNTSNNWHPDSCGQSSFAFGNNSFAKAMNSIALGFSNNVSGDFSFAAGAFNAVNSPDAAAIGSDNNVAQQYAFAGGYSNTSSGLGSVSLGYNNESLGSFSTALGGNNAAMTVGSVAIGTGNSTEGNYATTLGRSLYTSSYGATVIGQFNDMSNTFNASAIDPLNRIFEVGNGSDNANRSNAFTILQNGNVGIGILNPSHALVVSKDIRVDGNDGNTGTVSNTLRFGGSSSGEAIGSKRTAGGNTWGLDFYTNSINRMQISNTGAVSINNDLTVHNGKGIVRSIDGTQLKKQNRDIVVNVTLAAGATTSINFSFIENFSGIPDVYIGQAGGSGGWAEVIMSLGTPTSSGGTLFISNPRTSSISPSFTVRVIAMGPQ